MFYNLGPGLSGATGNTLEWFGRPTLFLASPEKSLISKDTNMGFSMNVEFLPQKVRPCSHSNNYFRYYL